MFERAYYIFKCEISVWIFFEFEFYDYDINALFYNFYKYIINTLAKKPYLKWINVFRTWLLLIFVIAI